MAAENFSGEEKFVPYNSNSISSGDRVVLRYEYSNLKLIQDEQGCWHGQVTYNASDPYGKSLYTKDGMKTIDVVLNGPGKSKAWKKIHREIDRLNNYWLQRMIKHYI